MIDGKRKCVYRRSLIQKQTSDMEGIIVRKEQSLSEELRKVHILLNIFTSNFTRLLCNDNGKIRRTVGTAVK